MVENWALARAQFASLSLVPFKPGEFEVAKMFKVYIGNLENGVTLEQLKVLLAPFTDLEDLVLVTDPETGQSRCFAIAMFRDAMRGQLVIETLNGKMLVGRPLVLNEAAKKRKGLPPKKEMKRPGQGRPNQNFGGSRGGSMGGMGGMGGADAGPRGPARVPSGRPSSRPFGRGNARRDFGSQSGSSGGNAGGFSRPQNPGEPRTFSRPGGSAGFSRPGTPERSGSPDAPRPLSPQPPPAAPRPVAPQPIRPATPRPPAVRRSDAPDEESPKGT